MEWKINKGSKSCIACNKEFCEEEEYYSSLYDENSAFVRKDYCTSCWNGNAKETSFSFWKTKLTKRDKPVQKFINVALLLDMFIKLEGKNETHQRNLRYVLALYLIRKKIFKLKSWKKQENEEFIILHYPREDREFNVFDPNLKEEEIESLTKEMNQLISHPYMEYEITDNVT